MAALGAPVVPDVYSQNAGESALVGYTVSVNGAAASAPTRCTGTGAPASGRSARSPASSGASAAASTAVAANSPVMARNRARESFSSSATPSACSIVDTGTGMAPIRMVAR